MDQIEAMNKAIDQTAAIVAAVKANQLEQSTPCAEFTLRALLNHTVGGIKMFDAAARGGSPDREALAQDQLGDDAAAAYDAAAASMKEALTKPAVLDDLWALPFGTMPGAFALGVGVVEVVQHGWDIARASGQSPAYDNELAQTALDAAGMMPADQVRLPGVYGPETSAPDDAPVTDRLAAFLGRTV
jgi:uncharacterized protein (TIGR03086 family)